jgi:hypothetical protein
MTKVRDHQATEDEAHAADEAEERGHEAGRVTAAERSPGSPVRGELPAELGDVQKGRLDDLQRQAAGAGGER